MSSWTRNALWRSSIATAEGSASVERAAEGLAAGQAQARAQGLAAARRGSRASGGEVRLAVRGGEAPLHVVGDDGAVARQAAGRLQRRRHGCVRRRAGRGDAAGTRRRAGRRRGAARGRRPGQRPLRHGRGDEERPRCASGSSRSIRSGAHVTALDASDAPRVAGQPRTPRPEVGRRRGRRVVQPQAGAHAAARSDIGQAQVALLGRRGLLATNGRRRGTGGPPRSSGP